MNFNWNWWYVVAIMAMVASAMAGAVRCYVQDGQMRRRFPKWVLLALALAGGVVITVMVAVESFAGVVQHLDDTLLVDGESSVWSLVFAPVIILVAGIGFGAALYVLGVVVDALKQHSCKS